MRACVLDTETTAREAARAEVIELALAEVDLCERGITVMNTYDAQFKPRGGIEFGALAAHHILREDLEFCGHWSPTLIPQYEYYIGHNVDFDWEVVGKPEVKRICTLAMARELWPECDSHSLSALMYFLNPLEHKTVRTALRSAHSAKADVAFCIDVLKKILNARPDIRDFESLWAFSESARIPKVMTFGKFEGMHVSKVDNGWRAWYRKTVQPQDPYLLKAFNMFPYEY